MNRMVARTGPGEVGRGKGLLMSTGSALGVMKTFWN